MSQMSKVGQSWHVTFNKPERVALEEAVHHHPLPHVRERCAALLKIAQGHSPHWVAKHGLLRPRDPDSVYQWLQWYQNEGLMGLVVHRHGGPHRIRLRSYSRD
ncbi:hypothetical protein KSB_53110 [Ktedonobacter robiniae]|uniref:Helix-turn-helix domain-containing protein n=1 Tax=Ktedonobacter robiniae TaxID=2778365 RepID=A0ABQ3UVW6_9CHLR|nr:hypothetical protein KSB_47640 [Ktedonobacter robiniae]GHO56836.1 hypothetical protein KSB_53110 [Ktedonobacter robiniae]